MTSADDRAIDQIDPDDLAATLRVLGQLHHLPADHPDLTIVKRAASHMYKAAKQERRLRKREAELAADRAVTARTATGSNQRIDDETAGIPLVSSAAGAFAGELRSARGCYICKQDFVLVDAFYHWLCPSCAAFSHAKRDQRTDLSGRRALLTGGRAKIGMYIALRLLRDGADTTITTRFPRDAVRRFAAMPDAANWIDRLTVVGIDLRDPTQVIELADRVSAAGPLDILINNACQTVRRSPGAYSALTEAEQAPLPRELALPELVTLEPVAELHPATLTAGLEPAVISSPQRSTLEAAQLTQQALSAGHASLEAHLAGTAVDAGGLLPDLQSLNSWTRLVDEVDPLELLEVQLCNSIAPFLLISRLRPAMRAAEARRRYVVNVSAMEGQFSRRYKGPGHPHTNMAKASLNMLTRTSSGEMFQTDQILMTAVDTGWITDERPHQDKVRIAAEGWRAPLDLVDGAARVYDPIVQGEAGEDLYGCFLKDYRVNPW